MAHHPCASCGALIANPFSALCSICSEAARRFLQALPR